MKNSKKGRKNEKTSQQFSKMQKTCQQFTVRAEISTEFIVERAGPVIFETFLLEFIACRLIPVICLARKAEPEIYWKR